MEMCEGALNIIDLAGSEAADSDATKEVQAETKVSVSVQVFIALRSMFLRR